MRTEPRFTRDADLAVTVSSDEKAEALIYDLRVAGYQVEAIAEQEATERLATVRLSPTGEEAGVLIDLLFASSGIEPEVVAAAETLQVLPAVELPVATTAHLIALESSPATTSIGLKIWWTFDPSSR